MKSIALALLLAAGLTVTAHAGPPHIRAELRGHPTAGGFIVLSTFHHGTQQPMTLLGTAEGLVDGARRSVALRFEPVPGEIGVYTVPKTWGDAGVWVLNIATPDEHGGAGVVVGVDRHSRPVWQQTPRTYEGLSRPASAREVTALLTALEAGHAPPELRRADLTGFFGRNSAPLTALGLLATGFAYLFARVLRGLARRFRRSRATVAS